MENDRCFSKRSTTFLCHTCMKYFLRRIQYNFSWRTVAYHKMSATPYSQHWIMIDSCFFYIWFGQPLLPLWLAKLHPLSCFGHHCCFEKQHVLTVFCRSRQADRAKRIRRGRLWVRSGQKPGCPQRVSCHHPRHHHNHYSSEARARRQKQEAEAAFPFASRIYFHRHPQGKGVEEHLSR